MATEHEFRFLVGSFDFVESATHYQIIQQGYLGNGGDYFTVRVRITDTRLADDSMLPEATASDLGITLGQKAYLTIKSPKQNHACDEYEYSIPVRDAQEMMKHCRNTIKKTRYHVPFQEYIANGLVFEVDVFGAEHRGLCVAELECPVNFMLDTTRLPAWIQKDVSDDHRLSNAGLARDPDVIATALPMDRTRMLPVWLWYDHDPSRGSLSRTATADAPGFRVSNVVFHSDTHRQIAQNIVGYMNELMADGDCKYRVHAMRSRTRSSPDASASIPAFTYQLAGTGITHRYKEYTTQCRRDANKKNSVLESRLLFDIDDLGIGYPVIEASALIDDPRDSTRNTPNPRTVLDLDAIDDTTIKTVPQPYVLRELARCFLAEYAYLTPSDWPTERNTCDT